MLKNKFTIAIALACSMLAAPGAWAQALFGYDSFGQLISIDSSTAATTAIGASVGLYRIGLARSVANGMTYTRSFDTLYTVDLSTGVNTTIGASGSFLTGLAFNLSGTQLYSVDQSSGAFYAIDLSTGAPTLIGQTGLSGLLDLATSPTGVVYATNISNSNLYTINTSTGAATLVPTSVGEALTAIGFDSGGNLFGVGIGSENLYSGILTSPTSIGNTGYGDIRALLFANSSVTDAVPEPETWLLMVLGFGAIGVAMRRRAGALESFFSQTPLSGLNAG